MAGSNIMSIAHKLENVISDNTGLMCMMYGHIIIPIRAGRIGKSNPKVCFVLKVLA